MGKLSVLELLLRMLQIGRRGQGTMFLLQQQMVREHPSGLTPQAPFLKIIHCSKRGEGLTTAGNGVVWNGTGPVHWGVEEYVRDMDVIPGMALSDENDLDL